MVPIGEVLQQAWERAQWRTVVSSVLTAKWFEFNSVLEAASSRGKKIILVKE